MAVNNVGSKIKALRKQKNYTLKDMNSKTGISVSFLSDIENGRSNPSLDRLTDIANALGTSVSYLLGENISGGEVEAETLADEFLDMLIRRGKIKTKKDLTPQNVLNLLNEIFTEIDNK